jgi:hypothetical protein
MWTAPLVTQDERPPVRERRWPGGRRWVAWLAVLRLPSGVRSAAHSCGSASVSHRLPPPRDHSRDHVQHPGCT